MSILHQLKNEFIVAQKLAEAGSPNPEAMLRWVEEVVTLHELDNMFSDNLLEYFDQVGRKGYGSVVLSMDF